jgi:hypothetical protein
VVQARPQRDRADGEERDPPGPAPRPRQRSDPAQADPRGECEGQVREHVERVRDAEQRAPVGVREVAGVLQDRRPREDQPGDQTGEGREREDPQRARREAQSLEDEFHGERIMPRARQGLAGTSALSAVTLTTLRVPSDPEAGGSPARGARREDQRRGGGL